MRGQTRVQSESLCEKVKEKRTKGKEGREGYKERGEKSLLWLILSIYEYAFK